MIKKYFLMFTKKKKGSAAVILSLIVSGAILSTIYISQQSVDSFLSAESKSGEDWEYNFVAKSGIVLGAYLVSNNLILCKEGSWDGHDAACKWNDRSAMNLSGFTGLSDNPVVKTQDGRRVLSIKAKLDKGVINNPVKAEQRDIEYVLTFDLVNWKEASVSSLIGEIPAGVCRWSGHPTKPDMVINDSGSCTEVDQVLCKDSSDADIPNTVCENIAELDQDYTIVLISVTTPLHDDDKKRTMYAGVRRPFAVPIVKIEEPGPVCELSCAAANNAVSLAECRGPFVPNADDDISTIRVKVTNQGPGAIYALSFMRKDTFLGNMLNDPADDTQVIQHVVNLLEDANKEVLLPGDSFIFEDYVDCADTFSMTIRRAGVWSGVNPNPSASEAINMHAQPFMTIVYQIGSMGDTVGSCMAADSNGRLGLIEGGTCPETYSPGESCVGDNAETGQCYYSHVEPRRTASFLIDESGSQMVVRQSSVTVTYIVPH